MRVSNIDKMVMFINVYTINSWIVWTVMILTMCTYANALSEIIPILLLISRSDSTCVPSKMSLSTDSISDDMTSMWLIRVPVATSKKQICSNIETTTIREDYYFLRKQCMRYLFAHYYATCLVIQKPVQKISHQNFAYV